MRILHPPSIAALFLMLNGCGANSPPPATAIPAGPEEQLARLVASYWDEYQHRAQTAVDDISPQYLADSLALERRYLAALLAVARPLEDPQAALTYELFRRGRETAVEGFTYPFELLPVNPFDSMPLRFARAHAGAGARAVSSEAEYQLWLAATDGYVRWTNQAIANLRDGARRGYTVPRVLIEEMLPPLAALGEDSAGNAFYAALSAIPATLPEALHDRLRNRMSAAIKEKILPAYRSLHEFLRTDYLPRTRTSVGLSALPLGAAWYAYLVRSQTGARAAPADIHALGEAEVERIHGRLKAQLAEIGYLEDARAYLLSLRRDPHAALNSAGDIMSFYAGLKDEAAAALPSAFTEAPPADVALRPAQGFEAGSAPPVSFQDADPGEASAGVLYVNVAADASQPRLVDAPLFLREAFPGRLFQSSVQRARADLPKFRRYGADPGFVAGWASYAATLGEELGLYRDPASKFLVLLGQLKCAAGLVADTGVHAQGWSRQRAIDYLAAKLPIEDEEVRLMADRVIALPGAALACTMGERKIRALRAAAEQTMGARFDVRSFHAAILDGGAMPLDLMESNVRHWVDGRH